MVDTARKVIKIEAESVKALLERVDGQFVGVVEAILKSEGRVILLGIGKSGIIAQKIAATLSSTGTPAYFVHPVEGMHGDLGMIRGGDVVIALSNSGETGELIGIIPSLQNIDVTLVAMTGVPDSRLGNSADFVINTAVKQEACPFGLVPTSSTTAALVIGDALAVCLMREKEFKEKDFALFHPGGSLGRRLLAVVNDIMHGGDAVPVVTASALLPEVVEEMTAKTFGITAVVDKAGKLVGVISDGDLRRLLGRGEIDENIQAVDFMTGSARTIESSDNAASALQVMESNEITSLFICDENGEPVGIIHMHDILGRGSASIEPTDR
ncbi:MAG: KpsF/GutQ family sugar-phosphate isomerase [bacterium]|nr:KpsF/GutQ family sugar-phosphate isomerase [bacterium]